MTSFAGPLLNVSRESPLSRSSCLASPQQQQQQQQPKQRHPPEDSALRPPDHLPSSSSDPLLLIDGVPISEADITATNGIIHRLSSAVMAPPNTVARVLMDPPFPLSAAGALTGGGRDGRSHGDGSGFEALGELVRLAGALVDTTLTEEGPLTFLAPTDAVSLLLNVGDLVSFARPIKGLERLCDVEATSKSKITPTTTTAALFRTVGAACYMCCCCFVFFSRYGCLYSLFGKKLRQIIF